MPESEQYSLQSTQTEVNDYTQQFKAGYFSLLEQVVRLTEEVGELVREVNHYYGEKQKKVDEKPKTVPEELGDVFLVLISMVNPLEVDLTEVFEENMAKLNGRDRCRFGRKDRRIHD